MDYKKLDEIEIATGVYESDNGKKINVIEDGHNIATRKISVSTQFLKELEYKLNEQGKSLKDTPFEKALSYYYTPQVKEETAPISSDIVFEDNAQDGADIGELFNGDDLEKKSDLSPKQILAFSRAKTFADMYGSQTLNEFIKNYLQYSISKNRAGRSEFVEAFKIKVLEPMGLGGIKDEK